MRQKFNLPVVAPLMSMIHFDSRPISRELKGRTRTATLTDDMTVSQSVITQYFWKEQNRIINLFMYLSFVQLIF